MILVNGQIVSPTLFPDGTSQVWKLPQSLTDEFIKGRPAYVQWSFSDESELIQLAQLKDLLDTYNCRPRLGISYLPYARQDKEIKNDATFALHSFAKILNSLEFETVEILDPHSDMALHLIENSIATYPLEKVHEVIKECEATTVCYPDSGAYKKYLVAYNDLPTAYVFGKKVRDQSTGLITSYELIGLDENIKDQNVLIVDDICDGGATFTILAKDLLAKGAKSVSLFVTHGIFSKGLRVLLESGIKRVYTPDGKVGPRSGSLQF